MKSLFITLLLLGGAFSAYDYFLAPPGQKIIFTELNPPKTAKPAPAVATTDTPPTPAEPAAPAPEPAKPAETAPAPAPVPTTPVATTTPSAPAAPKAGSIEALTNNWSNIPPSAFHTPREVTLKKDTEFKMAAGASKVAAGRKVYATAFKDGQLALIPAVGSTASAIVPLDDTDLKDILTAGYEKWKTARAEYLKKVAEQKKALAPVTSAANTNRVEADDAGRPVRAADGSYPLLLTSIRRGQVTDIKPSAIISWGEPVVTQIQGKTGYAVKISYNADTIFGPQAVDAQALVVNGQVQGWFYTGSGEEVP